MSFKDFRYACEILGLLCHDKELLNLFNYLDYATLDRHLTLEDIRSRFFFIPNTATATAPATATTIDSTLQLLNKKKGQQRGAGVNTPVTSQRVNTAVAMSSSTCKNRDYET